MKLKACAALSILFSISASAAEFAELKTKNGVNYGVESAGADSNLAIILTTDIKESLTDVYSPIGTDLKQAGFTLAAVDAPCHGKDAIKGKSTGLQCWSDRASESSADEFAGFVSQLREVIVDIRQRKLANTGDVTVIGVSRGGYLAFRAAAGIPDVTRVVAMAPVTDVFRLKEFDKSTANKDLYALKPYSKTLAQKHIFMQISNNDERVGTHEAVNLAMGIVSAASPKAADLTLMLSPRKGHFTTNHDTAAQWVIGQYSNQKAVDLGAPK